jgi:hypothetical protein
MNPPGSSEIWKAECLDADDPIVVLPREHANEAASAAGAHPGPTPCVQASARPRGRRLPKKFFMAVRPWFSILINGPFMSTRCSPVPSPRSSDQLTLAPSLASVQALSPGMKDNASPLKPAFEVRHEPAQTEGRATFVSCHQGETNTLDQPTSSKARQTRSNDHLDNTGISLFHCACELGREFFN